MPDLESRMTQEIYIKERNLKRPLYSYIVKRDIVQWVNIKFHLMISEIYQNLNMIILADRPFIVVIQLQVKRHYKTSK